MSPELISLVRDQLASMFSGTFFLLVGLLAFAIAAIRRRSGVRILLWIGLWSAMFGANELLRSPSIAAALSPSLRLLSATFRVVISYLLVVVGTLSFYELCIGRLRPLLQLLLLADSVVAIAGIISYFVSGSASTLMMYNNLLSAITLAVLVGEHPIPGVLLSRRR